MSSKTIHFTADELTNLAGQTKILRTTDSIVVYVCTFNDQKIGYGFVDNVKGKTQLITYLAAVTPRTAAEKSYSGRIVPPVVAIVMTSLLLHSVSVPVAWPAPLRSSECEVAARQR